MAGRGRGFDDQTARRIVVAGVRAYRDAIRTRAGLSNVAMRFTRLDVAVAIQRWGRAVGNKVLQQVEQRVSKARPKTR